MTVAIMKTEDPNQVGDLLDRLGGIQKFVSRGERVLIKPNICAARSSNTGTVTDPELCAAICRLVADCGGKPAVTDSPIYPFRSKTVMKKAGYADFKDKHGFDFFEVDKAKQVRITINEGRVLPNIMVARPVLDYDVIINVPVMKTHVQTIATLGLKNLKGLAPAEHKHLIHIRGLNEGIVDLNTVFKTKLTIVDAICGQDGILAPVNGRMRRVGALVAGDNVVETDTACLQIMDIPLKHVEHIGLAEERGLGRTSGFDIVGDDIELVRTKFEYPKAPSFFTGIFRAFAVEGFGLLTAPVYRLMGKPRIRSKGKSGEWLWDQGKCTGCQTCIKACPTHVLSYENKQIIRDKQGCIYCFCCVEACLEGAVSKLL